MTENKKFSFSITQNITKSKVNVDKLPDASKNIQEETDFVTSLEGTLIKSTKPKKEKQEIIVPLIKSKKSVLYSQSLQENETSSVPNTEKSKILHSDIPSNNDTSEAVKELIADAHKFNQGEAEHSNDKLINGLNGSAIKTEKNDDTDEEPEDADYDGVPVEFFGTAVLRGMGWKPADNDSGMTSAPRVEVRPKGLGLGADASVLKDSDPTLSKEGSKAVENLVWRSGAFCQIITGKHNGLYGTIEGIDGDQGRIIVRLTVSKDVITPLQATAKLVTPKEYQKYSKYINKVQADAYKEAEAEQIEKKRQEDEERERRKRNEEKRDRQDRENKKRRGDERDNDGKRQRNEDIQKSHSKSRDSKKSIKEMPTWIRPRIRVRIVDKHFLNGRYYKQKVEVLDMVSRTKCTCRTETGKIVDDVPVAGLETVIPKETGYSIMVVKGKHKGEEGELVEKMQNKERAIVRLLEEEEILTLSYDEISEYIT